MKNEFTKSSTITNLEKQPQASSFLGRISNLPFPDILEAKPELEGVVTCWR